MKKTPVGHHTASLLGLIVAVLTVLHPGTHIPISVQTWAASLSIGSAGLIQIVAAYFAGKAKVAALVLPATPASGAGPYPGYAPLKKSAWSDIHQWASWIAYQLSGMGFSLADCQVAVDSYVSGLTVSNPGLANNLHSMIYSTGTVDGRYVPPGVVAPVKGANPVLVQQLADAVGNQPGLAVADATAMGIPSPQSAADTPPAPVGS